MLTIDVSPLSTNRHVPVTYDVSSDARKPFWWDVATWLAIGQMDSIGIANNHMCRSRMYESEAWGRPRDAVRLPAPRRNGFWTQEIYYHSLNAGLRLPPSAGSASGVLPNPVGYNRVYVHLDKPFSRDSWFEGLSRGNCFVTNGPLLRVTANGCLPGETFKLAGKHVEVELSAHRTSRDRVQQLEVISNGRVAKLIPCDVAVMQHKTVRFTLAEPGWFLVRAITDVEHTFRFASTAPWFVESDSIMHRISRPSVRFFLNWVDEGIERIRRNVTDADQLRAVLEPHENARAFWTNRVQTANANLNEPAPKAIEESSAWTTSRLRSFTTPSFVP